MNHILGESSSELKACLERIANALENANQDTIDVIRKASQETEEQPDGEMNNLKPEERFIIHVDRLNRDFQRLVHSFSEGDAQNINFMEKYPFTSFSLIELAEAVNEWSESLKVVDKVEEDKKRKHEGKQKED